MAVSLIVDLKPQKYVHPCHISYSQSGLLANQHTAFPDFGSHDWLESQLRLNESGVWEETGIKKRVQSLRGSGK